MSPGPCLRVLRAGPMVTLQDGGRRGYQRLGISGSGPMDRFAHALACRLVEMPPGAAALEVGPGGVELEVEAGPVRLGCAGGRFDLRVDDTPRPWWSAIGLRTGQRLRVGAAGAGMWAYLAPAGGFALAPVLGSLSTHTLSRVGGLEGRPLRCGDRLPLAAAPSGTLPDSMLPGPPPAPPGRLRVVLGPQEAWFSRRGVETFLEASWRVSGRVDRMGYRLEGPAIEHARSPNIVSDGTVMGSVQVPGAGAPIVLMADRQTTGGYPKIATVIGADLGALAQTPPGGSVRFEAVDLAAALRARAAQRLWLERSAAMLLPLPAGDPHDPRFLLSVNLVSGVTAGGTDADGPA